MSHVRGKDTKPEMIVRRVLHRLGYRFRIHRRDLPGAPDLVFPSRRKVIFVHGCYWHRHECPKGRSVPASNTAFWLTKFQKTVQTDLKNIASLQKEGWQIHVIWECEVQKANDWQETTRRFLDG
jgi:DNA mismatch endonuclease (patch repair protein)